MKLNLQDLKPEEIIQKPPMEGQKTPGVTIVNTSEESNT